MYRRAGASQTDPSASRGSSRVPPLVWCWEPLTCPCLKTGVKGRGGSVGGEDRHADRPDVGLVVPRGGAGGALSPWRVGSGRPQRRCCAACWPQLFG